MTDVDVVQEAIDELRIDPPADVEVQLVVESWERIKRQLEMGELAFKVLGHAPSGAKKWTPAEFDEAIRCSKGGGY